MVASLAPVVCGQGNATYTPATESAIAQFTSPAPYSDATGSVLLGVQAYHLGGIDRVEYFVEGGTALSWDLNGDNVVDGADLVLLLENWGTPYTGTDLSALQGEWGMTGDAILGTATAETVDPATGSPGWYVDVPTSSIGSGRKLIGARVYPIDGVMTTLTGDPRDEADYPGVLIWVESPRPIANVPADYATVGAAQAAGFAHIRVSGAGNVLDLSGNTNDDRPMVIEGVGPDAGFNGGQMVGGRVTFMGLTFRHADVDAQQGWMGGGNFRRIHIYRDCVIDGNETAKGKIKGGAGGSVYMIDTTVQWVYSWEYPRYVQRCLYSHYLADILKSGFLDIFTETTVEFLGNIPENSVPEGFAVHTDFWQSNHTQNSDHIEDNIVFTYNTAWNDTCGQLIFGNFSRREADGFNCRLINVAIVGNALGSYAGLGASSPNRANMISFGMPVQNMIVADNAFYGGAAFSGMQDEVTGQLMDPNGPNSHRFTNVLWSNNYKSWVSTQYTMPSPDGPQPFTFIPSNSSFEGRFVIGEDSFPFLSPLSGVMYVNDWGTSFTYTRKQDNFNNTTYTPWDM